MSTMNPAVSFDQFVALAEQDGRIFFGVLQAAKSFAGWWLRVILVIFLSIPLLIFAQIVPFIFRKHLSTIFPALPYIEKEESLHWLRDTFLLYYYALKGYNTFCLFRKSINSLIDELDENIESLEFALEHRSSLQKTIESIEHSG